MKIIIESGGMELTESVRTYADRKFRTLEKFVSRFEKGGEIELHVEILKTTQHHRKGDIYQANANIRLPGKMLNVGEKAADVHTAIDLAKDVLKMEIEKYKARIIEPKRGASKK
jgi:putative sigma-54 modulation protein